MLRWFVMGDVSWISLGCTRLLLDIFDESAVLGRLLWLVHGVVVFEVATRFVA